MSLLFLFEEATWVPIRHESSGEEEMEAVAVQDNKSLGKPISGLHSWSPSTSTLFLSLRVANPTEEKDGASYLNSLKGRHNGMVMYV